MDGIVFIRHAAYGIHPHRQETNDGDYAKGKDAQRNNHFNQTEPGVGGMVAFHHHL